MDSFGPNFQSQWTLDQGQNVRFAALSPMQPPPQCTPIWCNTVTTYHMVTLWGRWKFLPGPSHPQTPTFIHVWHTTMNFGVVSHLGTAKYFIMLITTTPPTQGEGFFPVTSHWNHMTHSQQICTVRRTRFPPCHVQGLRVDHRECTAQPLWENVFTRATFYPVSQ